MSDNKYLYSLGGISKIESNIQLQTTIERLDLNAGPHAVWQNLNLRLNEAACDIGCLPISSSEILIFGGWNKTPIQGTYILKRIDCLGGKHELKPVVEGGIERPDFFMLSGVAMKIDASKIKVCGHTQLFTFDL